MYYITVMKTNVSGAMGIEGRVWYIFMDDVGTSVFLVIFFQSSQPVGATSAVHVVLIWLKASWCKSFVCPH
jgi:hypothetical protein